MASTLVLVLKLALILIGAILLAAPPAWGQGPLPPTPSPWSFEVTPCGRIPAD